MEQVEIYHCHIFEANNVKLDGAKSLEDKKVELLNNLMRCALPDELLECYARTHPYLWQRINKDMFKRLTVVANTHELKLITTVLGKFDRIISLISGMCHCSC